MFRYKNTSPPRSLEAAILMICDSVEATVRSKEHNDESIGVEVIKDIIRNTCERLEDDDQLDELAIGDLKKIKKALQRDLVSKYHKRDSKAYDESEKKTVKESKK